MQYLFLCHHHVLIRSPRINNFLWIFFSFFFVFLWVSVGFFLFSSWIVTRWYGLFYYLGSDEEFLFPLGIHCNLIFVSIFVLCHV